MAAEDPAFRVSPSPQFPAYLYSGMPPARAWPPAMREPCSRSRPRLSSAASRSVSASGAVLGRQRVRKPRARRPACVRPEARSSWQRRSHRCAVEPRPRCRPRHGPSPARRAAVPSVLPSSDDNDAKKMGRSSSGDARDHLRQVASGVVRRDEDDQLHGQARCEDAGAGMARDPRFIARQIVATMGGSI